MSQFLLISFEILIFFSIFWFDEMWKMQLVENSILFLIWNQSRLQKEIFCKFQRIKKFLMSRSSLRLSVLTILSIR